MYLHTQYVHTARIIWVTLVEEKFSPNDQPTLKRALT